MLLNNALGYPELLKMAHLNVEVIILPGNTTSLFKPLDKEVILTFKTYYTRCTFHCNLGALELTIGKYWKDLNIAHCISTIKGSLDKVKASTINACCQKHMATGSQQLQRFSRHQGREAENCCFGTGDRGEVLTDIVPRSWRSSSP